MSYKYVCRYILYKHLSIRDGLDDKQTETEYSFFTPNFEMLSKTHCL